MNSQIHVKFAPLVFEEEAGIRVFTLEMELVGVELIARKNF